MKRTKLEDRDIVSAPSISRILEGSSQSAKDAGMQDAKHAHPHKDEAAGRAPSKERKQRTLPRGSRRVKRTIYFDIEALQALDREKMRRFYEKGEQTDRSALIGQLIRNAYGA